MATELSAVHEEVQIFLNALQVACAGGNAAELSNLHNVQYPSLGRKFYSETSWPSPEAVAPLLPAEGAMVLYRDLYFRHVHTVLDPRGDLRISHRFASWEAFNALFELAARDPNFAVPSEWIYETVGQFVHQFQRFCEYRNKVATLSEIEKELMDDAPEVWGCYAVIQCLVDVAEKSGVRAILDAVAAKATAEEPTPAQALTTNQMLGYFAIGGLARLQLLLGDYHSTLQVLDALHLQETGNFSGIRACHVMLRYVLALAYLLSHRYAEAIIAGSALVLDLERQPRGETRPEFVSLKATSTVYLLAVAVSQCPGSEATLDPRVKNRLKTNSQVRAFRDELRVGNVAAFRNIYRRFAGVPIVPVPMTEAAEAVADVAVDKITGRPIAAVVDASSAPSLQQIHFAMFVESCAPLAPLLSLHSYLNLYRTIPLRKLALVASSDSAREEEATVDTLRAQLTCLKFKTQQENAERARFANDPRFQLYIERLRMRMQAVPDGLGYYLDGVRLALFLCVSLSRDDDIVSTVVLALFCAGPTKPKPCSAAGVVTADTIHAPV